MLTKIKLAYHILFKGGESEMTKIYCNLIIKGIIDFKTGVPEPMKVPVADMLRTLECEHLINEEGY